MISRVSLQSETQLISFFCLFCSATGVFPKDGLIIHQSDFQDWYLANFNWLELIRTLASHLVDVLLVINQTAKDLKTILLKCNLQRILYRQWPKCPKLLNLVFYVIPAKVQSKLWSEEIGSKHWIFLILISKISKIERAIKGLNTFDFWNWFEDYL